MAKPKSVANVPDADVIVLSDCQLSLSTADKNTKNSSIGAKPGDTIVTVHVPGVKRFQYVDNDFATLNRKAIDKAIKEGKESEGD